MTNLAQQQAGTTRHLPGAARARGFAEPARYPTPDSPPRTVSAPPQEHTKVIEHAGYVPPPVPESPAEWPTRTGRLLKVLSLGFAKPAPGLAELAHRGNVRLIRTAIWPRSVRIVVANPKGGSGKTTTAVVLGGILGSIRGGSVAVWDAADAAGTLASRGEGDAAQCVSDIANDSTAYDTPSAVSMVAATQTSFADIIGSTHEREFARDEITAVSEVLDRAYRVSVADTGNVPHSGAFEAVIERADILVVPTILTADSVNKAVALLQRLLESTEMPQRAIVAVLHAGGPETPGLAEQVDQIFGALGVGAVVHVPFDPHLGVGTAITVGTLSHSSLVAWTELAAATVANLTVN